MIGFPALARDGEQEIPDIDVASGEGDDGDVGFIAAKICLGGFPSDGTLISLNRLHVALPVMLKTYQKNFSILANINTKMMPTHKPVSIANPWFRDGLFSCQPRLSARLK